MIEQKWWEDKRVHFADTTPEGLINVERPEIPIACDFISQFVVNGSRILDLCCGPGRYSIALSKRDFNVTGLDINEYFLDVAKTFSQKENANVDFIKGDMREIPYENEFDAVISAFTSFGFFEDDENQKVLDQIAKCLKPDGIFFLEIGNRDWIVRHFESKSFTILDEKTVRTDYREFDQVSGRLNCIQQIFGETHQIFGHSWRAYTLKELLDMIKKSGLHNVTVHGGWSGKELTLESNRMLIVSRKS